ncbi:MAG: preprotein translocase subunit SecE [Lachnospiraceae bacterium]|nr:preprotein translocase subunit SecE [Lachnospiraceae bacterium]
MAAKENGKAKQSKMGGFFKGVRTEFGKIIWPSRETMVKQLIAVVVVTVITGLLIAVIDYGAQNLIDVLVKVNAA